MATARNIGPLTSTVKNFTDWVGFSDQDDYYVFTLTDTETVNAKLSGVSTKTSFSLFSASAEKFLLHGVATPPDGSDQVGTIQLAAGTYYIDVTGKAPAGTDYTLSLWTGAPKVGTSAVDSAGNTILAARNIGTLGTAARSFADWVGSTDHDDYYQFSITKPSTVDVEVFGATGLPGIEAFAPQLSLFDSTGLPILHFEPDGSVVYDLLAGTYYLDVSSFGLGVGYNVSFAATPLPANGAGDSIATAVDLGKLPLAPAPTGLELAAGSDSGVKGDGITKVTKPVITGKGVAGDTVTLFDGAKTIGSGTVGAGGAWSITPAAALAAGVHSLSATETSAALGTSAASAPLKLTIKTSTPAPAGLAFAVAADMGSAGDTFTVTGKGEAGDTVTLYDGAVAIGSATVAAGGTWSLTTAKPLAAGSTTSPLGGGAHVLSARETDVAGNLSPASLAQSITLKSAAPDNTVVFVGTPGADNFTGGPGNDYFYFTTANLAASDRVTGGGGADNLVVTTAGAVPAGGVAGVELYWLDKTGADSLSLTNGNFAGLAGSPPTLTVEGGNAGNTVNAAALTGANRIVAVGGAGLDTFIGGAGSDIFRFSAANLGNTDIVKGGGGTDYLAMTSPGAMHVLGVAGVEVFDLSNAAGAADNLVLGPANFAGTAGTIWIYGGNPGSTVSAAAATGAERLVVHAGSAAETATGGPGNDVFWAGGKTVMTGHGGANLFVFTAPGTNTIIDFTVPTSPGNEIELIAGSGFSLPGATATPKPLGGLFIQDTAGAFTAATQRFAYGAGNGNLYYSASGSTAGEQLVAHLTGDPHLSASQIAHLVFAS